MNQWFAGARVETQPPCPACRNAMVVGTITLYGEQYKALICICGTSIIIGEPQ